MIRCVSGPAVAPCPYVRQRCMSAVLGMQHVLAMPCCGIGACDPPTSSASSTCRSACRCCAALRSRSSTTSFYSPQNPGQIARLLPGRRDPCCSMHALSGTLAVHRSVDMRGLHSWACTSRCGGACINKSADLCVVTVPSNILHGNPARVARPRSVDGTRFAHALSGTPAVHPL